MRQRHYYLITDNSPRHFYRFHIGDWYYSDSPLNLCTGRRFQVQPVTWNHSDDGLRRRRFISASWDRTSTVPNLSFHSATEEKKTRFTFECSFEAQITSTRRIRSYIRMNETNPSQWTFLQLASFVIIPTVLWKRNPGPARQWPPKLRKPVVKPRPFYYAPPSVFWDHGKLEMWNSNVMIWTAKTMHVDYLEQ